MLEIVYQDDHLIAINKPHGLLVHRSSIANDAKEFALQLLRDQVNRHVSPVHRLDRKTGGLLLFAFEKDVETAMQQKFMNGEVQKKYLAVLRGYAPDQMAIDYPLAKENGTIQEAFTAFVTLKRAELDIAFGKHPTSRYSLVEASPTTGRMHQLRKHFAHIFYPIIGDRKHGCNKQNKFFKETWDMTTMLLHASELTFLHPVTGKQVQLKASVQTEFLRVMDLMKW
ncbi:MULTISPECIES: pseudouridine synthase [Pedobacter]|uniref:Pseudouridine synthase n=1 Tax=Pedobacter heparinus (strain ATCC 13125 / DSM 2366 / CIP 104194 / JCM 7457 / NBRC 12017 / NCIMB 9290 / NRRL B-14731 / HIM 762-3) TaxID=485917 RepID=C6XYT0_PEDHD|nr:MULTISPECIES: pseudouridine synthase [Pedobacter]ACU04562.1 pseudouridine synthase [Pedobacter heparinus DSM 2366]MBB5437589.1 tRNA pseudouridine65 synthase [Pedobacter sp. AK017]